MRFLIAALVFVVAVVPVAVAAADSTPTPKEIHAKCIEATKLPNVAGAINYPDRPGNEQLIADIEGGIGEGYTIENVWVAKSTEVDGAWFVAANMHGPNLLDDGEVALWVVGSINDDGEYTASGFVYAVSPLAIMHSNWGDVSRTPMGLGAADDGAQDAIRCADTAPFKG